MTFPFFVMLLAAVGVFVALLRLVMRRRHGWARQRTVVTALVVVIGGMAFGKVGANQGFPWWIYYPIPAIITVFVPPLVFRMTRREFGEYVVLAVLAAPLIHLFFSLALGWGEFMPFLRVPPVWELL
jgi:hypothetical protein